MLVDPPQKKYTQVCTQVYFCHCADMNSVTTFLTFALGTMISKIGFLTYFIRQGFSPLSRAATLSSRSTSISAPYSATQQVANPVTLAYWIWSTVASTSSFPSASLPMVTTLKRKGDWELTNSRSGIRWPDFDVLVPTLGFCTSAVAPQDEKECADLASNSIELGCSLESKVKTLWHTYSCPWNESTYWWPGIKAMMSPVWNLPLMRSYILVITIALPEIAVAEQLSTNMILAIVHMHMKD